MKDKKLVILPLIVIAVFTLVCFNIDPADGIVTNDREERTARWEGADYVTTVKVELNDTIINTLSGELEYWFDTSILDYSMGDDGYTVTLDFDVRPNELTTMMTAPSLNSGKLTSFNTDYSFMDKELTNDNILMIMNDLNNIPLITRSGTVSLSKEEPIVVNKAYRAIVTLENTRAGTREARFKLGRNSFQWTVTSQQHWEDNTLTHDNTDIVDGRLVLENAGVIDWWDTDWDYRVPITVTGDHQANYQLRVSLDISSDLGGHAAADFDDIRFTENADGDNGTYDYWIESIVGDNGTFWIERADASDNTDNTIYCYYGGTETAVENGEDTFLFFDEFANDNGLEPSKWDVFTNGTNTAFWDDYMMKMVNTSPTDDSGAYSDTEFERGIVLEFDARWGDDYAYFGIKDTTASCASTNFATGGLYNFNHDVLWQVDGLDTGFDSNNGSDLEWGIVAFDNGGAIFDNDRSDDDWSDNHGHSTVTDTTSPLEIGFGSGQGTWWVDNVIVRVFHDPAPICTVGAELEHTPFGYAFDGVWTSTHWLFGSLATIDNLIISGTSDLRGEWDIGAGTTNPWGFTYVEGAPSPWIVLDATGDNVRSFSSDFVFANEGGLSDSGSDTWGINFGLTIDGDNMFLICETENIDNYDESFSYQNTLGVEGNVTIPHDVEYMENDDTYYILSGDFGDDSVYVRNSLGSYFGMQVDLGLANEAYGIHYDNDYWYATTVWTDRIYQYDNDFTHTGYIRSVGADDAAPIDIHSNAENIYVLGNGTDYVYMYRIDNTLDNIYASISYDDDNDNIMDENTGWHLMDESGYWLDPENVVGYNFQVAFRIESSDNAFSPRIGDFQLSLNYYMEWVSVDVWSNSFKVEGETVAPLVDLNELMNVLLPLMVLFAPAFAMAGKMGEVGFMGGLLLGTFIVYIAFNFGLGIVIFLVTLVAIMFMKAK